MSDTKKYYEYKLTATNDDEIDTSRKYFFTKESANEHNHQYSLNDAPRRLVKAKGGEVMEKPEWWSGNLSAKK
jgi:hypothetical protein